MKPATRLAIINEIEKRSDGHIRQFFLAHGYDAAYSQPKLANSSKAARIAAATGAADKKGDLDALLEEAVQHFDLEGFDGLTAGPAPTPTPTQPTGDQARQI